MSQCDVNIQVAGTVGNNADLNTAAALLILMKVAKLAGASAMVSCLVKSLVTEGSCMIQF